MRRVAGVARAMGGAAAPPTAPPPPTGDEPHHLRALAAARFDPALFARVFSRGGGGPPPWLEGLVASEGGRALVYHLSSVHRNCLLLSYAVRRALKAGPPDEVAGAGPALAAHCSVFLTLAVSRLAPVPAAPAADLLPLAADLAASLCGAQHAYAAAAALLARLGARPGAGARFRRLAQELQAAAAAAHGPPVWDMARWFLPADAGAGAGEAAAAVAAVARAAAGTEGAASAILALAAMYRADDAVADGGVGWGDGSGGAAPAAAAWHPSSDAGGRAGGGDAARPPVPPLAVVRQPVVFDRLIEHLFTPGRAPGPADGPAAALLATAAAAADDRADGGGLDAGDVPGAAAAIAGARGLALGAAGGARFDAAASAAASRAARVGAAAAGVLHTACVCLGDAAWWRSTLGGGGGGVPPLVAALAAVLPRARALARPAVAVAASALAAAGNARPDAARSLADLLVMLIVGDGDDEGEGGGAVVDGLAAAERWAAAADPSLVRHFLRTLLASVAPPYSPLFAGTVLRLLAASGVRGGRAARGGGARDGGPDAAALAEFAAAASRLSSFEPPLSAKEAALLEELAAA